MSHLLGGRYRVLGILGEGGMGSVYEVADTLAGDRVVALKTMRTADGLTPMSRLWFKEEFRAMSRLRHPNTVEVFDFGQLDERTLYLTMEVVPGEDLHAYVAGRAGIDWIYPLLIQILQALEFIHSRHYVHRDIKPGNIRVRDDGVVKLMDFGLMAPMGTSTNGLFVGTPGYMPPEAVKGGVINAASDLYSVGCLAYQLLVGTVPFVGDEAEVARAHVHEAPTRPRALRPHLPERLEAIVLRLLEKQPSRRYAEAAEVIADLADLAGMPVTRQSLEQRKSYLVSSALIGREHELQHLEAALADARAGIGSSMFVGAPAGVGKSRLVHELVVNAKLSEAQVLVGQARDEGMSPGETLAQALRPVLALSTEEELRRHGPVLLRLFPELAQRGVVGAPPLEAVKEQQRLHETVVSWLRAVAARVPLVILLEDLHWADVATLHAFNAIIRETGADRILCVATFRNDECPLTSPLWFTIDEGKTIHLSLRPLSLRQTMVLIQAMLRSFRITRELCTALYDGTGGNPFFVTEVLRYLVEQDLLQPGEHGWEFTRLTSDLQLPTSIEATVLRRLHRLSAGALAVARAAAVIGRRQDRELLLAVTGLDEDALFDHVRELSERQLLVREQSGYVFPHDRVREALYGELPPPLRRSLHQRCGEHLERTLGDRAPLRDLAHHFDRGTDRNKAYQYLLRAGYEARTAAEPGDAIDYLTAAERALAELALPDQEARQVELWIDLVNLSFELSPPVAIEFSRKLKPVLEAQGNIARAGRLMRAVVNGIKKLPAPLRDKIFAQLAVPPPYKHRPRTGGLRDLLPPMYPALLPKYFEMTAAAGCAYGFSGQPKQAFPLFEQILDILPFRDLPLEGAILTAHFPPMLAAGQYDRIMQLVPRCLSLLEGRDLHVTVEYTALVGAISCYNARCYQGYRADEEAVGRALAVMERYGINFVSSTVNTAAVYYAWSGKQRELSEHVDAIAQNSRKIGAPPFPWVLYYRAYMQWERGEHEGALAAVELALKYPHVELDQWVAQTVRVLKGQVHLDLGQLDEAQAVLAAAEQVSGELGLGLVRIQALLARGRLAIARGEPAAARRILDEALATVEKGELRNPLHEAIALRLLGEVARLDGDVEGALRLHERAWAIVSDPELDNTIEQGHVQRAIAEAHATAGRREAAGEALEQAAECYARIDNRHHRAAAVARLEALRAVPSLAAMASRGPQRTASEATAALMATHVSAPTCAVTQAAGGQTAPATAPPSAFGDTVATPPSPLTAPDATLPTVAPGRRIHPADSPTPPIRIDDRDEIDEADPVQRLLGEVMRTVGASEASFFRADRDGSLSWVASRNRQRSCPRAQVQLELVERALRERKAVLTLDVPVLIAVTAATSIGAELPLLVAAPVWDGDRAVAAVYCAVTDETRHLADEDARRLDRRFRTVTS